MNSISIEDRDKNRIEKVLPLNPPPKGEAEKTSY
jgi:hypothetical protein